jgi:hypothetical protein
VRSEEKIIIVGVRKMDGHDGDAANTSSDPVYQRGRRS